jgi:dCMP deaminase
MTKQLLLYLPVLHDGYEGFLDEHSDAQEILILGRSFSDKYRSLKKDIRALNPDLAARYLREVHRVPQIRVIEVGTIAAAIYADELYVPDESVMQEIIASINLPTSTQVIFNPTFLRWDKNTSTGVRRIHHDCIETNTMQELLLSISRAIGEKSSDWWRHVGAIVVRDREVILKAFNQHQPTEYAPYFNGDPRASFNKGINVDLSTALHAEQGVVAEAAKLGIVLDGTDIYVSTFPCPGCARLVAASGIKRLYYSDEYAMLDGEEILRTAGVELVWIDMKNPSSA